MELKQYDIRSMALAELLEDPESAMVHDETEVRRITGRSF